MREYLKDPDLVAKRLAKRAENKKQLQHFFLHIGPHLRVMCDKYNISLIQKRVSEEGNSYTSPVGFFSTPNVAIPSEAKKAGASDEDIKRYCEKIKGVEATYVDGKLKLTLPKGFEADPMDINPEKE